MATFLTQEQEEQMVEEYLQGVPLNNLRVKYGFKTNKSITDKVKKYYGQEKARELIDGMRGIRKGYSYTMETISNKFDAYFLGLLLTDGYITSREKDVGLDLTDEDAIKFISETVGHGYKKYEYPPAYNRLPRYRIIISDKKLVENVKRYGIVRNKTLTLREPNLKEEEKKYLPYIIRGIIDGDGCVFKTSYGAPAFYICSVSETFINWCRYTLENNLYMTDIRKRRSEAGLWRIETAEHYNIIKLLALVYDKPFGMQRKFSSIRKMFNDYNSTSQVEEGIV